MDTYSDRFGYLLSSYFVISCVVGIGPGLCMFYADGRTSHTVAAFSLYLVCIFPIVALIRLIQQQTRPANLFDKVAATTVLVGSSIGGLIASLDVYRITVSLNQYFSVDQGCSRDWDCTSLLRLHFLCIALGLCLGFVVVSAGTLVRRPQEKQEVENSFITSKDFTQLD